MKVAEACQPESRAFADKDLLDSPSRHYGIKIEDAELTVFTNQMCRKAEGRQTFSSLMKVMESCPSDIFPNMNKLLRIITSLLIQC